ncbi:MAG TPA: glycosyltransferase 87 family protein [Polyangia bacterium]|jgi:hypothetical protein
MPSGFQGPWGINALAVRDFQAALRVPIGPLSEPTFRAGMRAFLVASSLAWVILCAALLRASPAPPARIAAPVWGAVAVAVAVLCPPSLSHDVYLYVGYARLGVVHHLNPYVAGQAALAALHDPTAPYATWSISSPYGPLWTLICMVPVGLARGASLWAQVVVLKLLAAGALIAAAHGGRRLAERLAPGRGDAVFTALSLQPFLLIEGPGNGHNDLVLVACVLWALAAMADERPRRALALVGVGAAVKFVPLLLAPWFAWRALRRGAGAPFLAVALVLALGPLVASYVPFWHGLETLRGLERRWALAPASDGGPHWGAPLAAAASYAALTVWALRGDARRLVLGWVAAALVSIVLLGGTWYPWYFTWPLAAALTLPNRRGTLVAALVFCCAAFLTLRYAAPV